MGLILNFEKWKRLYEEAAPATGESPAFASDLLGGASLVKPFVSKTKPGFIVSVKQPISPNKYNTDWSLELTAYRINSADGTASVFTSRMKLRLPSTHPSAQIPEVGSISGLPTPTDAVLPKGSELTQDDSDKLKPAETNYTVFVLYSVMQDYNISPEEYANLLDSAAPGTKAKMIEMAKSKMIVTHPTTFGEALLDPNIKKLYDWAVSQS